MRPCLPFVFLFTVGWVAAVEAERTVTFTITGTATAPAEALTISLMADVTSANATDALKQATKKIKTGMEEIGKLGIVDLTMEEGFPKIAAPGENPYMGSTPAPGGINVLIALKVRIPMVKGATLPDYATSVVSVIDAAQGADVGIAKPNQYMAMQGMSLSPVEFTVLDVESLMQGARADAVKKSAVHAERLRASGLALGRLVAVSEPAELGGMAPWWGAMSGSEDVEAPLGDPRQVEKSVALSFTYQLD